MGSLSMKICGEGVQNVDGAKSGTEWRSFPSSYPLPHFRSRPTHGSGLIFQSGDASAQETAGRGHREVSLAGVCACPHLLLKPHTPAPNSLSNYLEKKESGIQVRVCREVLNLCGESERVRDALGRMRFTAPHPGPRGLPTLPGRQSRLPRLPKGAEQSLRTGFPGGGEFSSPAPRLRG